MNPSVYDKSLSRVRSVQVDGVVNQCNNMQHVPCVFLEHKVLGARTLLGAPGIATRSKKLLVAPGLTTRSKKPCALRGLASCQPPDFLATWSTRPRLKTQFAASLPQEMANTARSAERSVRLKSRGGRQKWVIGGQSCGTPTSKVSKMIYRSGQIRSQPIPPRFYGWQEGELENHEEPPQVDHEVFHLVEFRSPVAFR